MATLALLGWLGIQHWQSPSTDGDVGLVEESEPPIPTTSTESLVVVENLVMNADELRQLEDLFEPFDQSRSVTDVVALGESVLCDVLTYEDGRVAYTFLTPESRVSDSGTTELIFKSETSVLHPQGTTDRLAAPMVIARENQQASVTIGGRDGPSYSIQFSGLLIGNDSLALSVTMTGDPALRP